MHDNQAHAMKRPGASQRRRWLRFSLKGLLVAMAVLSAAGGYVLREWRTVEVRRQAMSEVMNRLEFQATAGYRAAEVNEVSWVRQAFDDKSMDWIVLMVPMPEELQAQLSAAYPEAVIFPDNFVDLHEFKREKSRRAAEQR